MPRFSKVATAATGLILAALMLSGCAAVREFIAQAPVTLPQPSLPAAAEPFEKMYQGGSKPEGLAEEEWATKSQRRIIAAGALHKIVVYGVEHQEGSDGLTVRIKGDPTDAQLIADVEQFVVPIALKWTPTVTVVIDPSICGVVSEFRDSKTCDKLAAG